MNTQFGMNSYALPGHHTLTSSVLIPFRVSATCLPVHSSLSEVPKPCQNPYNL